MYYLWLYLSHFLVFSLWNGSKNKKKKWQHWMASHTRSIFELRKLIRVSIFTVCGRSLYKKFAKHWIKFEPYNLPKLIIANNMIITLYFTCVTFSIIVTGIYILKKVQSSVSSVASQRAATLSATHTRRHMYTHTYMYTHAHIHTYIEDPWSKSY